MKNDNIKFVLTSVITLIISSFLNAAASDTLFNSNEVVYDNSSSNLNSTNVQGAVDELYAAATDYSGINSRLQILEILFPQFETTSTHSIEYPFTGNGINLGKNSVNNDIWFDIYYNGKIQGSINPLPRGGVIVKGWKDGNGLQGDVELAAKNIIINGSSSITIGGEEMKSVTSQNLNINSTYTKSTTTSYIKYVKWGKMVIVTMNDICPKASVTNGAYTIASGLPASYTEVVTTINSNVSETVPAYRVRVSGSNLQWNWSYGNDSCALAAGEIIYFAA